MGRLLRFRAWDSNKNEMLTGDFIEDRHPEYRVSLAYGSLSVLVAATCQPLELMQSTGMYDRHGKEIYESDVLNYKGIKTRVEWDADRAGFVEVGSDETFSGVDYGVVEVIGNIYEHPHLMQDQPRSNDGPT